MKRTRSVTKKDRDDQEEQISLPNDPNARVTFNFEEEEELEEDIEMPD